jgi:hypothetical protein
VGVATTAKKKSGDRWAWSVGSAWRGDPRLLAHIARVACEVVEEDGKHPLLQIGVEARDDREEFPSVERFLDEVTPQALSCFTRLSLVARGGSAVAEVLMARKAAYEPPFGGSWGVVVRARAAGGAPAQRSERALAMCDRLRVAVRRGSSRWTRGLRASEAGSAEEIRQRLFALGGRHKALTHGLVTMLASTPFWLAAGLQSAGVVGDAESKGTVTYLVIAQCLILTFGASLAGMVMPAIEVAETTPGRRALRLIARSGLLSAASGLIVAFIRVKAGLF